MLTAGLFAPSWIEWWSAPELGKTLMRTTSEFDQPLHGIASLLARGYLRFASAETPEAVNTRYTPAVLACLEESAPTRLSVPSGLRLGESETPRTDHEQEDDRWRWM